MENALLRRLWLVAEDDIPKPSLTAFSILHELGRTRIPNDATDALVTKREDGSLVIALWNLVEPGVTAPAKDFAVSLKGAASGSAQIWRADAYHGDTSTPGKPWAAPSIPPKPRSLHCRKSGRRKARENAAIQGQTLKVTVPAQGLAVIVIPAH